MFTGRRPLSYGAIASLACNLSQAHAWMEGVNIVVVAFTHPLNCRGGLVENILVL